MRKTAIILAVLLLALALPVLSACGEKGNTHYSINCVYQPGSHSLTADVSIEVFNRTDEPMEKLSFYVYPLAYAERTNAPVLGEDEKKGKRYGDFTLTACSERYDFSGVMLYVTPNEPVFPDEKLLVEMSFTVLLTSAPHRLSEGDTVNLGWFYPVLTTREITPTSYGDPFVSEVADYDVTLTVPTGFEAVCAGTVTEHEEDGARVYEAKAKNRREFSAVISSGWEREERNCHGVSVTAYYNKNRGMANVACEAIETFSELFGSYPYPEYKLVEADFPYGGMEYSGLAVFSELRNEDVEETVVHETAHQWWYGGVGNDQVGEAWLDEGLAEYSTILYYEKHPEKGVSRQTLVEDSATAYRSYYSVYRQLHTADLVMKKDLAEFSGRYEYTCIAYKKSVVLFDRLRGYLGERAFFAGLKKFYRVNKFDLATSDDLCASFGEKGGELIRSFELGKCVI